MAGLKQVDMILEMIKYQMPYSKIADYLDLPEEYVKGLYETSKREAKAIDLKAVKKVAEDMCLMDDDCMSMCLDGNKGGVGRIINTIMPDKKFTVMKTSTQHPISNAIGHNVTLDILAEDRYGNKVDIEIQNSSSNAIPNRARYYSSMLDYSMLKAGAKYKDLKDSYVIFITQHDILKGGEQLYHIDRVINETTGKFADGSHILYVNCEIKDDTPLGRLIQDLYCRNPDDMYYKELRERMEYLKKTEEGVREIMGPLAEMWKEREVDIREEDMKLAAEMVEQERMKAEDEKKALLRTSEQKEKDMVRSLAGNGVPVEVLARSTNLSVQEIKAIIGR